MAWGKAWLQEDVNHVATLGWMGASYARDACRPQRAWLVGGWEEGARSWSGRGWGTLRGGQREGGAGLDLADS